MAEKRFTVIGAGHGGRAMAAHLSLMGYPVTLYNRTFLNISAIASRGGLDLYGAEDGPRGFAKLERVTSDAAEAAEGDILMVVVPSSAHADIARLLAPHLRDEQIIVLHPGRTGGCMEFR